MPATQASSQRFADDDPFRDWSVSPLPAVERLDPAGTELCRPRDLVVEHAEDLRRLLGRLGSGAPVAASFCGDAAALCEATAELLPEHLQLSEAEVYRLIAQIENMAAEKGFAASVAECRSLATILAGSLSPL